MRNLAIFLLLLAASGCTERPAAYTISFLQGGSTVKADGDRVMLKKAPFTVLIKMSEPMGVFLNFQAGDRIYRAASSGKDLYEPGFAMAEYTFNPEKIFLLTPDTYHYWYYDGEKEHRFDRAERKGGQYLCYRDIENYGLQGDATLYPISGLPHGRVYMTAFNIVKKDGEWKSANVSAYRLVFH